MECETNPVKITGTVIFMPSNTSSKSEAVLPYLYNNKNEVVQIYFEGDNPFENNTLVPFDGKKISVTGYKKSDKKFLSFYHNLFNSLAYIFSSLLLLAHKALRA